MLSPMTSKIRLFVDHPLAPAQSLPLTREHAHYLFSVMRQNVGDRVLVFNGQDGEWLAEITQAGKKSGALSCLTQSKALRPPPDLWLLFAPIKKTRTDFIVEKATELGAARICPVQTTFTNSERIRRDRLQAHAVEAAEQCGGTYVPVVDALQKLKAVLDQWPEDRSLLFCDETQAGAATSFAALAPGPCAILIGPEGGFDAAERQQISNLPNAHCISLGPRILRADTAAVTALSLWQAHLGDWT